MNSRVRALLATLLASVVGVVGSTALVAPAAATITTLCTGYTACAKAGMSPAGYAANSGTMWWRMYAGHNCTNYAAYRMVKSGLPNVRPWSGGGNATYWGTSMPQITDDRPAVGAVAWWKAGVYPAGSSGHVAYVEKVVSADEIIISQDSWGGDFSWARVTRSKGWPSGFIHFNDVPLVSVAKPTVAGDSKVGSTLTVSRGTWSPADAQLKYQWRANGSRITGATASTYVPTAAQEGSRLSVRVTATKLGYPSTSVVTAATAPVQPGVISNTRPPSISGAPRVDSTLTAHPGLWHPVPDTLTLQWLANGAPIRGATTSTLQVDPTLVGKTITVTATAGKQGYADVRATSRATAAVQPGVLTLNSPPTLSGDTVPGATLTLTLPQVTPASQQTVQWFRGAQAVPGATGPTYPVTTADLGARISAQVVSSRPGYTTLTARTTPTRVVRATPRVGVVWEPGDDRVNLQVRVTARGVSPVVGVVRLKAHGQVLREVRLRDGAAAFGVRGLKPGRTRFRLIFAATPTVSRAVVVRALVIR